MLEDIESIPVSSDSFLVIACIDSLNHVLYGLLDVIPGFVQIVHVHLQIFIVHLTGLKAFHLLGLEILEMIASHSLDHFD